VAAAPGRCWRGGVGRAHCGAEEGLGQALLEPQGIVSDVVWVGQEAVGWEASLVDKLEATLRVRRGGTS
jgi:hypothetical protein